MQMQQIELLYTNNKKYLKYGEYIKYFENNVSIDDMLDCIKDKNIPVLIKTNKDNIKRHKLSDKSSVLYSYEVAQDIVELGDISSDLLELHTGKKTYICYSVKPELQDRIGKIVYLTKDKDIKEYIMKNSNDLAIEVNELREFHNKVMSNDKSYIVKLMFDGSEVD